MENGQSRFGVGPRIALTTLAYAALAGTATHRWPGVCLLRSAPFAFLPMAGVVLLLPGIAMLAVAVVSVARAHSRGQLVTSGVFALCRHPLYAAWIVLILPGVMLLTGSWPLLIAPLVAYVVFKVSIHQEDDYLGRRFGAAYAEYRAKVNELIPFPKI